MSKLTPLSDRQINQLLTLPGLSVVLLSAAWDGDGIILNSILAQVAEDYPSAHFYSADYESSPQLARMSNLLSPPGIFFIREGEFLGRLTGPVSAARIRQHLDRAA